MQIHQIIEGRHEHSKDENNRTVLPGHTGAVTLIQSEGKNIIIDTGARGTWEETTEKLNQIGLKITDIDIVLLTHLHLDHSYHVALFPQAQLLAWSHDWKAGETREITGDLNHNPLPIPIEGITAIRTPGHDECMNSFIVQGADELTLVDGETISLKDKKLIIAGDAINQIVIESDGAKIPYAYDEELYRASAQKILDQKPDFIIPGHGPIIVLTNNGKS